MSVNQAQLVACTALKVHRGRARWDFTFSQGTICRKPETCVSCLSQVANGQADVRNDVLAAFGLNVAVRAADSGQHFDRKTLKKKASSFVAGTSKFIDNTCSSQGKRF